MPEKTQKNSSLSEEISSKFAKESDQKMKEEEILTLIKNYSKQFNTDFFVCVKDKDFGKLAVLTTDTKEFTIDKITSVFMEKQDENVKDLKSINHLFDKHNPNSTCFSSLESIDSKNTSISTRYIDNKLTLPFYDQQDNNTKQQKHHYPIDQNLDKKYLNGAENSFNINIKTLFDNENDLTEPLFLNKVQSIKMVVSKLENQNQDIEIDEEVQRSYQPISQSKYISHAKNTTQEDFCCFKMNHIRDSFAQRHLFKSGFQDNLMQQEYEIEESSNSESYQSDQEDSVQEVQEADLSNQTLNEVQNNRVYFSTEADQPVNKNFETYDSNTFQLSSNDKGSQRNNYLKKNKDLFLACCDWESERKIDKEQTQDQKKYEDFSDSSNEQYQQDLRKNSQAFDLTNKECKRKQKQNRKQEQESKNDFIVSLILKNQAQEFDVDSIIKKVQNPNRTEKIVSTKRYFSKNLKGQFLNRKSNLSFYQELKEKSDDVFKLTRSQL